MKNVSALKSNNINSPKTPGGISKSLLTPCRRLGLSRNWKKKGPSPFISPIATQSEVKEEVTESRKRKSIVEDGIENSQECKVNRDGTDCISDADINKTPSRNVELPRKKKSKTLLSTINKSQEDIESTPISAKKETVAGPVKVDSQVIVCDKIENKLIEEQLAHQEGSSTENINVVATPVRSKSKKGKKRSPLSKSTAKKSANVDKPLSDTNIVVKEDTEQRNPKEPIYSIKEKSPNELRKECIVVIQRKIFKNMGKMEANQCNEDINSQKENKHENVSKENPSQVLFDSDSDDVPLVQLNKDTKQYSKATIDIEDDFIEKPKILKEIKAKETKSPKTNKPKTLTTCKKVEKTKHEPKVTSQKPSQSSFDDDDDDFDDKRTILIKKTYNKVMKPMKAKSTGSITQKDVDELKARVEAKKKLLLAKSITPETAELRTLIKKWQKGCQDALIELMDLMKNKFPDKQNMDYSEMLDVLKIPHHLVGYDSDNDCFNSPSDASALGQL